jgi:hypothetical protein
LQESALLVLPIVLNDLRHKDLMWINVTEEEKTEMIEKLKKKHLEEVEKRRISNPESEDHEFPRLSEEDADKVLALCHLGDKTKITKEPHVHDYGSKVTYAPRPTDADMRTALYSDDGYKLFVNGEDQALAIGMISRQLEKSLAWMTTAYAEARTAGKREELARTWDRLRTVERDLAGVEKNSAVPVAVMRSWTETVYSFDGTVRFFGKGQLHETATNRKIKVLRQRKFDRETKEENDGIGQLMGGLKLRCYPAEFDSEAYRWSNREAVRIAYKQIEEGWAGPDLQECVANSERATAATFARTYAALALLQESWRRHLAERPGVDVVLTELATWTARSAVVATLLAAFGVGASFVFGGPGLAAITGSAITTTFSGSALATSLFFKALSVLAVDLRRKAEAYSKDAAPPKFDPQIGETEIVGEEAKRMWDAEWLRVSAAWKTLEFMTRPLTIHAFVGASRLMGAVKWAWNVGVGLWSMFFSGLEHAGIAGGLVGAGILIYVGYRTRQQHWTRNNVATGGGGQLANSSLVTGTLEGLSTLLSYVVRFGLTLVVEIARMVFGFAVKWYVFPKVAQSYLETMGATGTGGRVLGAAAGTVAYFLSFYLDVAEKVAREGMSLTWEVMKKETGGAFQNWSMGGTFSTGGSWDGTNGKNPLTNSPDRSLGIAISAIETTLLIAQASVHFWRSKSWRTEDKEWIWDAFGNAIKGRLSKSEHEITKKEVARTVTRCAKLQEGISRREKELTYEEKDESRLLAQNDEPRWEERRRIVDKIESEKDKLSRIHGFLDEVIDEHSRLSAVRRRLAKFYVDLIELARFSESKYYADTGGVSDIALMWAIPALKNSTVMERAKSAKRDKNNEGLPDHYLLHLESAKVLLEIQDRFDEWIRVWLDRYEKEFVREGFQAELISDLQGRTWTGFVWNRAELWDRIYKGFQSDFERYESGRFWKLAGKMTETTVDLLAYYSFVGNAFFPEPTGAPTLVNVFRGRTTALTQGALALWSLVTIGMMGRAVIMTGTFDPQRTRREQQRRAR